MPDAAAVVAAVAPDKRREFGEALRTIKIFITRVKTDHELRAKFPERYRFFI